MAEADDYAKKYMGDGGLLYEAKSKAPGAFFAIVLSPMLLSLLTTVLVAALTPASALVVLASIPAVFITLAVAVLFGVLRVTVTKTHLHVQYGLFGPRIPLEAIDACEAVAYDWKHYGGFGIRRGRDGTWAYNMMGDQGRAVRLRWRDDKGKETVTLVSAPDPDELVRTVRQAKAGAGASRVRVEAGAPAARVAEPTDRQASAEAEAEAEAETGADERGRDRA